MKKTTPKGFYVPDGNEVLRSDIPTVAELIGPTARWVHPDSSLPVWAPHAARGMPLFDARWSRRYTNTRKATGITSEKFEGNGTVPARATPVAEMAVRASPPIGLLPGKHLLAHPENHLKQRPQTSIDAKAHAGAMRCASQRPSIGRPVSRLVLRMTIHAGAQGTSEIDPDALHHGSGSGNYDQSQFSEKLAELGLKRVNAYVRVAPADAKISKAAEDKRRYREQQKAKGIGQYPVEVPYDEDARYAVYAVAKAIVADKDNTKGVRSTILSVA